MSTPYDFSHTFQEKILSTIWRDPNFFNMYRDVIKPQYFETETHMDLARIIFNFYDKYEVTPTVESVREEVRQMISKSKVKSKLADEYEDAVVRLSEMNLADASYVKDKVIEFGKKQALTEAILDSAEDIQKGTEFDKIKERINQASQVGSDIGDMGTDYFATVEERMDSYTEQELDKIPTGIDLLDTIMQGGIGRGELGIVIAPPGTGKTLTLCNFGYSAIIANKNVAHFSFEMSEKKVAQRYDMRFTDRPKEYIKNNRKKVAKALNFLSKNRKGRLKIKDFPTRTATVDTIKAYLTKLRISEGFIPDVIILDYPDIMKPNRQYGEKRHELELLYEDVRALGQEMNAAVWGASQTNRGALAKKVVTIADLAESFGKAAVSDFMIALSQTKEEKRNGEVRYYIAKHRDGSDNETIHCDIFYDRMKVESNAERETSFDMEDDDEEFNGNRPKKKKKSFKKEKEQGESEISGKVLEMVKKKKGDEKDG